MSWGLYSLEVYAAYFVVVGIVSSIAIWAGVHRMRVRRGREAERLAYIPDRQEIAGRSQRMRNDLLDLMVAAARYVAVALATTLVVVPAARYGVLIAGGECLFLGLCLGAALRWSAS